MAKPIAVVAFGGNAILDAGDDGSFTTQLEKAKAACRQMLAVLHKGYQLILVHGNGPQVGNLLIQFEKARDVIPVPPLDVAVASSQGLLGHMLEISMRTVLEEDRMQRDVACVLTQVVVSPDDPAFSHPTKPIGPFYTKEQAENYRQTEGWNVVEDSGRGWRRVVCSPLPRKILELNSIKYLAQNDTVVITCGGGGIPCYLASDFRGLRHPNGCGGEGRESGRRSAVTFGHYTRKAIASLVVLAMLCRLYCELWDGTRGCCWILGGWLGL
jgi:carbamate kinase